MTFQEFYETWHRAVFFKIQSLFYKDPMNDYDDLAQRVFIAAWIKFGDNPPDANIWHWLRQRCFWESMGSRTRYIRKGAKTVSLDAEMPSHFMGGQSATLHDLIGVEVDNTDRLLADDIASDLVNVLSQRDREYVTLRLLGYSQAEIAGMLNCSQGTIEKVSTLVKQRAIGVQEISR